MKRTGTGDGVATEGILITALRVGVVNSFDKSLAVTRGTLVILRRTWENEGSVTRKCATVSQQMTAFETWLGKITLLRSSQTNQVAVVIGHPQA